MQHVLKISSEQLKKLLLLVDLDLKTNGLSCLTRAVDLYNLLSNPEPAKAESLTGEEGL
jgi:hypothetical protein